jgi:DNA-binding XRE family transcriptional regulator
MKAKPNTTTLDQFVNKHYGPKGTHERDKLDKGFETFKLGIILHEARKKAGLTQEELAQKAGTTKSYISKLENDIKEVRLSTLQKIVELGLGGKVEVSIKLDSRL